jgi:pyruvate/2-oxoglutarate dehydrogenase complex dihydrolipoamide dehydrogenase (E3) component
MPAYNRQRRGENHMPIEHYKNVVIGSGEAGKYLAWTLAKQGQRTVVVERSAIGGACPNVACLPSTIVIHSAKVPSFVRNLN